MHRLVGRLRQLGATTPHGYTDVTETFPKIDLERLARELELEEKAKVRGAADLPAGDSCELDDVEQAILARFEGEAKQALDVASDNLRIYRDRMANLDLGGNAFEVKSAALELVAGLCAILVYGSGGVFLGSLGGFAVCEPDTFNQLTETFGAIETAPGALGRLGELEDHGERSRA